MSNQEQHQPLNDFVEYPPQEMAARAVHNLEQLQRRHSIRSFSDRPVAKEVIEHCIRAAGTAPSGANHQPGILLRLTVRKSKGRSAKPLKN